MLDRIFMHVLDICDRSAHVLYHALFNGNMIPIITYTSHTFHHYIQWIANLEDRILTADTLLIYL